jgi:hypothetical protein
MMLLDTSIVHSIDAEVSMWELFQGWDSIVSVQLEDSTGYLLEFADEPMLLVRQDAESFGGLEQQSTTKEGAIKKQSLALEQD